MTAGANKTQRRLQWGLALAVLVVGGILVAADVDEARDALRRARWDMVGMAVLATAVSYACISVSFALIARVVGIRQSARSLVEVGFVSTVMNHIVQSGGVAGLSVRFNLMRGEGARGADILTASIIHFYLTSLAMLAVLPFGFAYLLDHVRETPALRLAAALATAAGLLIFAGATAGLLWPPLRRGLVAAAGRLALRLLKRDVRPQLDAYEGRLTDGVRAMRRRPAALLSVMALVVVDWLGSALALGYCFEALGRPLVPGVLFTGYVIGTMAGVVSMVPGGLGVLEGSMAGVFALLGVGFGRAVLATILFRAVYYFGPYFLSVGLYTFLSRAKRPRPQPAAIGSPDAHLDVEPRLPPDDQRRHVGRPEAGPRHDPQGP